MYAMRTENSNIIWILSEKEIKMAVKFQNVCPKLTDINIQRFFFWKFIFKFLIPAWNYQDMLAIYIASKKLGTQVVTKPKSKMAAKTQNGCRQCITVSPCFWTTMLILMSKCIMMNTKKSNVNVLSWMKTKMAAKFQNVCSNLTDINYHRVWCEHLRFVFGYEHGSFRIYVGHIFSSKSDGTQVSLLFGIQDGGQNSKWLPPMCSYRVDYSSFWTKSRKLNVSVRNCFV